MVCELLTFSTKVSKPRTPHICNEFAQFFWRRLPINWSNVDAILMFVGTFYGLQRLGLDAAALLLHVFVHFVFASMDVKLSRNFVVQ